jgi:hypothetical protein
MARQGLKLGAIMGTLMAVLLGLFLWMVILGQDPATASPQPRSAEAVASVHPQSGPQSNARTR